MISVNGKIIKGEKCIYVRQCGFMKYKVCNGKGCPFIGDNIHDRDFSCAVARLIEAINK